MGQSITKAQDARSKKHLESLIRYRGVVMTRAQYVVQLIGAGYRPGSEQVPRIKEMSRRAFNNATYREQEAHERRMKEAGFKTEYFLKNPETRFSSDVSKTMYDYALSVLSAQAN